MPIFPILLIAAGGLTMIFLATSSDDQPVPDHPPDLPVAPRGKTRWKRVNDILDKLAQAAKDSGIPLGVLVGWIAKESGGRIEEVTPKYNERGLFQLMPAESASLDLDHERLSTDVDYSIHAGILLIQKYMKEVDRLGVAPKGSTYYWRLVKLCHTMGSGAVEKILKVAEDAGDARTWNELEEFALENDKDFLKMTKHSPKKWFPFVDEVAEAGDQFGFGTQTAIVGSGPVFDDIIDPLDCLTR